MKKLSAMILMAVIMTIAMSGMALAQTVPDPFEMIGDILNNAMDIIVDIFKLDFLGNSLANLVAMMRFLVWLMTFSLFYMGAKLVFARTGNNRIGGIVAFCLALIVAIFLPENVLITIGSTYATVVAFLFIAIIPIGGMYLSYQVVQPKSRLDHVVRLFILFTCWLILFWVDYSVFQRFTDRSGTMFDAGGPMVSSVMSYLINIFNVILWGMIIFELIKIISFGGGSGDGMSFSDRLKGWGQGMKNLRGGLGEFKEGADTLFAKSQARMHDEDQLNELLHQKNGAIVDLLARDNPLVQRIQAAIQMLQTLYQHASEMQTNYGREKLSALVSDLERALQDAIRYEAQRRARVLSVFENLNMSDKKVRHLSNFRMSLNHKADKILTEEARAISTEIQSDINHYEEILKKVMGDLRQDIYDIRDVERTLETEKTELEHCLKDVVQIQTTKDVAHVQEMISKDIGSLNHLLKQIVHDEELILHSRNITAQESELAKQLKLQEQKIAAKLKTLDDMIRVRQAGVASGAEMVLAPLPKKNFKSRDGRITAKADLIGKELAIEYNYNGMKSGHAFNLVSKKRSDLSNWMYGLDMGGRCPGIDTMIGQDAKFKKWVKENLPG